MMSASPQLKVPFVYVARPLREIELMRLIGNIAWTSSREDQAFDSMATAVMRLPGFIGFSFEPSPPVPPLLAYETVKPRRNALDSFARAKVAANGRAWGEIKLFFDPNAPPAVESPLRLATFVGQQIGLMFDRLAIQRDHRASFDRLEQIRVLIRRRKLIFSAAAVLSKRRNISGTEAILFMARYAKRNRRRLVEISESLVIGCNQAMITRPLLRRLPDHLGRFQNTDGRHELQDAPRLG